MSKNSNQLLASGARRLQDILSKQQEARMTKNVAHEAFLV